MKALLLAGTFLAAALATAFPQSALTIYNQNFAVVRDLVPLDLKSGVNDIRFAETTAFVEPDSVILRDSKGQLPLQVLEQNYRNDPVSQSLLLSLNEGKTIDFLVREATKPDRIIQGKIIRSGYSLRGNAGEPIIEVDGKIQFSLPGQPVFPTLGDDTILKPALSWKLNAPKAAKLDAELSYITGGMSWEADYNIVSPENSDILDIVGWVTMNNQSGKTFKDATIKLMAGDVNKLQPGFRDEERAMDFTRVAAKENANAAVVTEKTFDEYHLYSLQNSVTLHDRETKQVEFIRASGVKSQKIYGYDGLKIDWNRWRGNDRTYLRRNEEFGSDSDTKVAVMREFKNSEDNHLGMPLPKGRVRFYREDGRQIEFIGENTIDHTPKDETVRVYTGNAFDLVGERKRTNFKLDTSNNWVDESFEIKLRNHKKEAVEIRVVEHLFRWFTWEITEKSGDFTKLNAQEIEFRVSLKPDEEKTITYKVHYSW